MTEETAADLTKLAAHSLRISETLNRQIKADGVQKDGYSHPNTLLCLCAEVLRMFCYLVDAHFKKQVQHTAWLARNLLELSIWCEYCARSQANTRTFFLDSTKDAVGFLNAFSDLISMVPDDVSNVYMKSAKEKLYADAKAESFELSDDFKKVHRAARELSKDHAKMFSHINIILSKLTHPTAMVVNNNFGEASEAVLVSLGYKLGFAFATASLDSLEKAPILSE